MRNFTISALLVSLLLAAPRAWAEFPSPSVYVGIHGGGTIVLRDWDLRASDRPQSLNPESSGMAGLRLGVHVLSWLAIEAELSWLPSRSTSGESNHILAYNLGLLVHLMKTDWAPFLEAGFGAYQSISGDLGKDLDPRGHVGLGLRGLLAPWVALRLSVRDVFSDGFDSGGANNLELTGGLDFFFWRSERKAADRDGDGVPDSTDECPDTPGTEETRGCPDSDGDGIADKDDRCPDDRGPASLQGCPDRDGDGVMDKEDRCPDQAGTVSLQGCPDQDGDGVTDKEDRCPTQKGPAGLKGCPDSDGDGVADLDDACPEEKGPAAFKGCPDKDGDGIPDKDDKCPDVPGLKELEGCMPAAAKKFTGAIRGITFAFGSAKISPQSRPILDETVKLLNKYPSMHLTIEGHTDNVGTPEKNQALSQARAEAVRDYLKKKGIEADRLDARGYGDSQPVDSNKTVKGRAANRRIEFKIKGQ